MPLLSESAARPIPAVTALRFLRGLVEDMGSVALRFKAMFVKIQYENEILDGIAVKENTAASADC